MSKLALKLFAVVVVALLYVTIYFITYLDGVERMNAAKRYVEIMTATVISVDSRIGFAIEKTQESPQLAEALMTLYGLTQDDFEVNDKPVRLPDTVTYPVKAGEHQLTLSVKYNYFLENMSISSIRQANFVDYAIIPTDVRADLPRADIRYQLDLDTQNYVYQSDTIDLGPLTSVKIVANIAKPPFYSIIYPTSIWDYLALISYCTGTYVLLLGIVFNITSLTARSRQNNLVARTDKVTGLYNRKVLDEHYFRTGDALVLFRLTGYTTTDTEDYSGDHTLHSFGRELSEVARGNDKVIRLGGGEFAIILTNPAEGAYVSIIGRLETLTTHTFIHGKATQMLGMSKSDLLNAADQHLNKK